MKKAPPVLATFCALAFFSLTAARAQSADSKPETIVRADARARQLVQTAVAAMGGDERLRALKSIRVDGIGHMNFLEQSERPEGPYIVSYEQTSELLDLVGGAVRRSVEAKDAQTPRWTERTIIVAGGVAAYRSGDRFAPAGVYQAQDAELRIQLGPERILFAASAAPDLRLGAETVLQNVPHHAVKFTWRKIPVTIFLNAETNLPTAVETVRAHPYEHFWTVWGDVSTSVYYSYWTLEAGGLRYPRQWDTERNGLPYRTFTVTDLALNPDLPADSFTIPEDVRASFKGCVQPTIDELPLGRPDRPAREIAEGVVQIPGRWNVALVRQQDGVVILEAPISSAYSAKVIAEAGRRFPGVPIKAVISTADSWPHVGGVREYVARAIPVYILDRNRSLLERLLSAPHSILPDALARATRMRPKFEIVSKKTVIGGGGNGLELYPVRSESGERMLMVYFPARRLLYGADLVQKLGDGSFFMPQYLSELMAAAAREKLSVEKVFAMHTEPVAWSEVEAAVTRASAPAAH